MKKAANKRYIIKCMFMGVLGRPRYNHQSETWWDGKIEIYPVVQQVEALKTSRDLGNPEHEFG